MMKTEAIISSQILNDLKTAANSFSAKASKSNSIALEQFYELEHKELLNVFNNQELIDEMQQMIKKFNQLVGVMNNNIKEGIKWYRAFERVIRSDFVGLEYIYLKQWAISVEALYYYKIKKNDIAFSLTLECLALNEMLIKEGISTLIFRSVEQNKNIGKIFLKMGKKREAFDLKRNLLNYYLNGQSRDLYGQSLYERALWNKLPGIRDSFAHNYFAELVYELATIKVGQEDYFFSVFEPLEIKEKAVYHIIYDWIELKLFWYEGDFDSFLRCFIKYMTKETTKTFDFTKITLIADVKLLLSKASSEHPMASLISQLEHFAAENFEGLEYFKNFHPEHVEEFVDRFVIRISTPITG